MLRRIVLILAIGAALAACSSSGSGTSTGTETLAPVGSSMPSEAVPSESASASPS